MLYTRRGKEPLEAVGIIKGERMSELPLISLVTPSFNQAQFLEQTLLSVLNQDYPRLEYIVIDGQSVDGSADIIRRYNSQLKYWVSEPDHGQAAAINEGFSHSSGEILGWLNSDDVLAPDALDLVGRIFARYPQIAWLTGLGTIIDASNRRIRTSSRTGKFPFFAKRGWYHGRLLGFIRQESTFWRRGLWLQAGGHVNEELKYGIDFDLWQRFAAHADLVTVHAHIAGYRRHSEQKTFSLDHYYREIGVNMPNSIRAVTIPARTIFDFLSLPFTPYISAPPHGGDGGELHFHAGPFYRPGIF